MAQQNLRVVPTAYTGIAAALLIGGGRTMHSRFRLPVPTTISSVSNMDVTSFEASQLRMAKMFIIDEASMVPQACLECTDRLLREITQNPNVPFGGKCVLLTGDFRQCSPVSDNERIETSIQMCLKRSALWPRFVKLRLTQNVRADPNEVEFKNWIMEIGDGRSRVYDQQDLIRIPDRVICDGNLIDSVFGEGQIDFNNRLNNVILCPTNTDSLEINEVILDRMDGEVFEYLSKDVE